MKGLLSRLMAMDVGEKSDTTHDSTEADITEGVEWGNISTKPPTQKNSKMSKKGNNSTPTTEPQQVSQPEITSSTNKGSSGKESSRFLNTVLRGLPNPTIVVNVDGKVTNINDDACELFGTTTQTAIGQSPTAIHGGQPLSSRVLESEQLIEERTEQLQLGADEIIVSRTIAPLKDADDKLVGAIETTEDITELSRQKQKTEQLENYQASVLHNLQDKIVRLAEGDLTLDSSVEEPPAEFDEIQAVYDEFTELNGHLMTAVDNYRSVLSRLTILADDLDETSQDLSANSEEVTASIEEISQSTEEMANGSQDLAEQTDEADMSVSSLTATIEEITASIEEIDAETSEASKTALEGVESGTEAVEQIRSATDATSEITSEVRTLESKMENVGEALDVIADIADQTNILALNASIEAARAGEAGEGFAVVADEVKKLAEESKESAAAIETIITDAQDQTASVAEEINHTNKQVSQGADAVDAVVDQIDEVESAVEQVSAATSEVSRAVESQAQNMDSFGATIDSAASMSEELSASVQQISAGLEQQSAATDKVADRATSLSATSEELYERIDQFRLEKDESADVDDIN